MSDPIVTFTPACSTRWIWIAAVRPNSYLAARRTVDLPTLPATATLCIFADTKYKLYINGRFVNAGPAPFRKPVVWVDSYDVAPWLRVGANTIAVLAHFVGCDTKYNLAEQPGLVAELRLGAESANPTVIGTDGDWQVAELSCWNSKTPRRTWALEHVEDLDLGEPSFALLASLAAADYLGGAPAVAESATLWQAPRQFDRPDLELRRRLVPNLRWQEEEVRLPRQIFRGNTEIYNWQDTALRLDHEHVWPELEETVYEATRGGQMVFDRRLGEPGWLLLYDFGRLCAGEPAAEIVCEHPCTLDLAMAENLTPAGRPNIWRNGGLYYARYHLQAGVNRVRFYHFNGYRYLYLSFKDALGTVEVRRLASHHCRADLDYGDRFAANDRAAESLYRICRRAIILNTQAYAYDCNTREQGAYWGDGLWIVDCVGHLSGDFSHLRHLCYAASDEVRSNGPFIPASLYGLGAPLYDYCLVPPECLWRYYRYTGDRQTVQDNVQTMREIVAAFRRLKADNGLLALANLPEVGNAFRRGLLFLDHPGNGWHPQTTTGIDRRDFNAGLNLYYLQAIQALAELEGVLGQPVAALVAEADELKRAILGACFVAAAGLVADAGGPGVEPPRFSQIVNALAITTGLFEGEAARQALRTVLDIARHPWVSQGTPYSTFFLAEAAARCRLAGVALAAFERDFADMLKRGATTTWEAWRAENHDSLNHAWSAPMPHLLRRAVIGLEALTPGYGKLALRPDFSVFDEFDCTCQIPAGPVRLAWRRRGPQTVGLTVDIPAATTGVLHLSDRSLEFAKTWSGEASG